MSRRPKLAITLINYHPIQLGLIRRLEDFLGKGPTACIECYININLIEFPNTYIKLLLKLCHGFVVWLIDAQRLSGF